MLPLPQATAMSNPVSKTKQLQKETLEYGRVRVETSPFQKFLEKQEKPKQTGK
jgi:hypothetical protein